MTYKTLRTIILLSFFLSFSQTVSSQERFSKEEVKAAYVFSFAKYVTWKKEHELLEFSIGVVGSDMEFALFDRIYAGRKLKNSPISLVQVKDISKIPAVHVLYVTHSSCENIEKIKKLLKKNTLMITDNCDSEENIMINFVDSIEDRKFELNIKNILFADLEISKKIASLGGGKEANWQDLYTKVDHQLESANATLERQKLEIQKQEEILIQKTEIVKKQVAEINKQEEEISAKKEDVDRQNEILSTQQQKIEDQKETLGQQLEKIQAQRSVLYLSLVILLILVGLAFLIYRSYTLKKRINIQLNEKNVAIVQQRIEIQAQADQLMDINKKLEKLSLVASKTDNSVVIIHPDGELEWVNEGFVRMYGYTFEEYKQLKGSNILVASDNPEISNSIKSCFEERKSVLYTTASLTKEGEKIWVQTTLTPISDHYDNLVKIIAIEMDVTVIKQAEERIREQKTIIEIEMDKSEKLLLNILPEAVAEDLKKTGTTVPKTYENVTVYFSDLVGFTDISVTLSPQILIDELNELFTVFDNISEKHSCERIKTIGDAYLMVCGMPEENSDHAINVVQAAIEIVDYLNERNKQHELQWQIRVGIHTGKVVGGVVGVKKYIYDVFGDTINTTARMESNSLPMHINLSETTFNLVKNEFSFIEREAIDVKGKGMMKMFFLEKD